MKNIIPKHKQYSPTKPFLSLFPVLLFFLLVGSTTTYSQRYIHDIRELEQFARDVNNGNTFANQSVYLENNIGDSASPFTIMIGNDRTHFQGYFNGNGKTIYVRIGDTINQYVGLFSQQTNGYLSGVTIMGSVTGKHTVGGIVGWSDNTILYCVNNATIYGGDTVGGIVGKLTGVSEFFGNKNAGLIQGTPSNREGVKPIIGGIAG